MRHCTNFSIRKPPKKSCLSVFRRHSLPDLASLSLSARRVSNIVSAALIRQCAWLITCCSTSSDFHDVCLARQSAIRYRGSSHLKSASPPVARDLTVASSIASPLSVDKELLLPCESRRADSCSRSPTTTVAFSRHPRSGPSKTLPSSSGSTMFSMHVAMLLVSAAKLLRTTLLIFLLLQRRIDTGTFVVFFCEYCESSTCTQSIWQIVSFVQLEHVLDGCIALSSAPL